MYKYIYAYSNSNEKSGHGFNRGHGRIYGREERTVLIFNSQKLKKQKKHQKNTK
jgi:ribosomal protein L24E